MCSLKCIIVCVLLCLKGSSIVTVSIDVGNCGIDHDTEVQKGVIEDLRTYPWVGIFYYNYESEETSIRAVTTVALIQDEFVIACAADIGPIPKKNFRENSRVLLGENWIAPGRRVRNYILHPEYDQTKNTIALIQLTEGVSRSGKLSIRILCPPPDVLQNPEFYVVKFKEGYEELNKVVLPMTHVPAKICKDFYVAANLYQKNMRPPYVVCAVAMEMDNVCIWNAGSALVSRDVWGRWIMLGLGVRGPGCGAPSRFLDMMTYYPWIKDSLDKFRRITISKINDHKYVLRSAAVSQPYVPGAGAVNAMIKDDEDRVKVATQRFGNCDEEEKLNILYRELINLQTDQRPVQFATYDMTILQNMEITCLTLELVNASATTQMKIQHSCKRQTKGAPCYTYKSSSFNINVVMWFTENCLFEMNVWGYEKKMDLLDILEWKWEEGSNYMDFTASRVEYRGQPFMTDYGFEPLDDKIWVPEYDLWVTSTTTEIGETPPPREPTITPGGYVSTTSWTTVKRTKSPPKGGRRNLTPTSPENK